VAAPVELVFDPVVKEDFAHLEEGGRRQERVGAGLVLRADPGHLEVVWEARSAVGRASRDGAVGDAPGASQPPPAGRPSGSCMSA
jgi:hypothetical protein